MKIAGDDRTLELLSWEPTPVAPAYPEEAVRAESLRGRLSRAVSQCLKECGIAREEIAQRMGEYLGENVSVAMLSGYASQAREDHSISAVRLSALCHATGDIRPLQILVSPFGHAVIPMQYLSAIEEAMLQQKKEELERRLKVVRRAWRAV